MNAPHRLPNLAPFDAGRQQNRLVEILPGVEVNGHQEFRVRFLSYHPSSDHTRVISEMIMDRETLAAFRESVHSVVSGALGD